MKFTAFTQRALAARRQERELTALGYEEVGEGGGRLWELYRGSRTHFKIVDAVIGKSGRSVWVKCLPESHT